MTENEFRFLIDTKTTYEFTFNKTVYNLYFDKMENGSTCIKFGPLYMEETFDSYGDLINNAYVENHYLKELIKDLKR